MSSRAGEAKVANSFPGMSVENPRNSTSAFLGCGLTYRSPGMIVVNDVLIQQFDDYSERVSVHPHAYEEIAQRFQFERIS